MTVDLSQQLLLFGSSILLGVCMGLLYDVLRAVRIRFPRWGGALDALCCLVCAAAAFFFVLRWGGELRLYILLGCGGGCVLFFCLLSSLLRPLWDLWVELLVFLVRCLLFPLHMVQDFLIKIAKRGKNLFLFFRKWVTIRNYKWAVIRIHRKKGAVPVARKEPAKKKTAKRPKADVITKVLILALLLLFGGQLYRLQGQVKEAEAQQAALATQVEQQRQENDALTRDIENGDNQELMQKIAREELNLVNPGEKIFYDIVN